MARRLGNISRETIPLLILFVAQQKPSRGGLWHPILMQFYSGPLMQLLSGVDNVAFCRLNLGYFDRYAVDTWPQNEVGVVLWSLSASAHDWLPRETLTRLCASPVIGVLESQWDFGSSAMEARILRPLWWFGLLESQTESRSPTEVVDRRLYRK